MSEKNMSDLLKSLDPIFADCVGEAGSSRYVLDKPWTHSGWVYATNGRIAVRQPTLRVQVVDKAPIGTVIFDSFKPLGDPIDLPDIGPEPAASEVCDKCKGKESPECRNCYGSGVCTCSHCDDDHGCATCNGEGKMLCPECDGDGSIDRDVLAIEVAPEFGLADHYVWLLWRHGITEIQLGEGDSSNQCRFRKGDIEGVLMRMKLPTSVTENAHAI